MAFVRVVPLHLHVALLVELGRVGEDLVHSLVEPGCSEDPVYEHGVRVGDDDAVDAAFVF